MRVLLDVRGGLACVAAVSRGRPGRRGKVVLSHPVLRASNDKATLRASLSRARVRRPRPVLAMRVTKVQKPDIRLRHWCAMKCEPRRFSDEENGYRVSDCIASLAEATSRLVWRVSSLQLGGPVSWRGLPFFCFLGAPRPGRRSTAAYCAPLVGAREHTAQNYGVGSTRRWQSCEQSPAEAVSRLQMESICEDDCNQLRFPKRGDAK